VGVELGKKGTLRSILDRENGPGSVVKGLIRVGKQIGPVHQRVVLLKGRQGFDDFHLSGIRDLVRNQNGPCDIRVPEELLHSAAQIQNSQIHILAGGAKQLPGTFLGLALIAPGDIGAYKKKRNQEHDADHGEQQKKNAVEHPF